MRPILAFLSIFAISYTAQAAKIETKGVDCVVAEKIGKNYSGQKYGSADGSDDIGIPVGPDHHLRVSFDRSSKKVTASVRLNSNPNREIDGITKNITTACDDHEESGNYQDDYDDILNSDFKNSGREFGYSCTPVCK